MTARYYLSSTNSDLSGGADFNKEFDRDPGLPTPLTITVAASATETSYGFTPKLAPGRRASVGVQDYTVTFGVKTAGTIDLKIQIRRIGADGTVKASSAQTAVQSLNSTGKKTFELPAVDLGTFEKDERIRIDYIFTETSASESSVETELDTKDTWFLAPWDAGLLTGNMRIALESAYVKGVWLVELDLPSPNVGGSVTTVRGAVQGIAAPNVAGYPAKVASISSIPLGVSIGALGVQSPDIEIEWEDTDFELAKIIEGPNGDDVIDSPVRIKFAVAGLAQTDWHTRFTGVVRGRSHNPQTLIWTISAGPDDRELSLGEVPRVRVSKSDFPDAPDDSLDVPAPQIYGIWNSVGVSNAGAVPTIYVDTVNFRYLVAHSFIDEITRVYKDDGSTVVLLAAAAWSRRNLTVNGRDYTLIEFTTDQGEAVITADVKGYVDLTGLPIERPSAIFYHWLANFVVGDYQGGAFDIFIPAIINNRRIEELRDFYEDTLDLVGAIHVADVKSAITHVGDFLRSWNYRAYFGVDGRLVIKALDHRGTAIYLDEPWVRGMEDEAGELNVVYEDQDLLDRVVVKFLQDAVAGSLVDALEVREPSKNTNVSETFEMNWGAAKII